MALRQTLCLAYADQSRYWWRGGRPVCLGAAAHVPEVCRAAELETGGCQREPGREWRSQGSVCGGNRPCSRSSHLCFVFLPWDAAQCWPCLLPPQSWINASAVAHAVGPSKLTSCRCPISCWARQIQAIFNQPWAQAQYLHRLRPSGAEECCCVLHR
jgi:hypothetical protein